MMEYLASIENVSFGLIRYRCFQILGFQRILNNFFKSPLFISDKKTAEIIRAAQGDYDDEESHGSPIVRSVTSSMEDVPLIKPLDLPTAEDFGFSFEFGDDGDRPFTVEELQSSLRIH